MLRTPTPLVAAITALIVAAAFGFVAGHGHSSAHAVSDKGREVSNGFASVSYPVASGWRRGHALGGIAGLAVEHELTLAPRGNAAAAGLILGQLVGGQTTPLPVAFLARLAHAPSTEVVSLQNVQAYHYSQLDTGKPALGLTLYVIPNPTTSNTVVGCYSNVPSSPYMKTCEQIAATVTLISATSEAQAGNYLNPDPNYARKVGTAIRRADDLLVAARGALRTATEPEAIESLASNLSTSLVRVTESVTAIAPPPTAVQEHAALVEALNRLRTAYSALGKAASEGHTAAYLAARKRAYEAGVVLRTVIENYSLLGYG